MNWRAVRWRRGYAEECHACIREWPPQVTGILMDPYTGKREVSLSGVATRPAALPFV